MAEANFGPPRVLDDQGYVADPTVAPQGGGGGATASMIVDSQGYVLDRAAAPPGNAAVYSVPMELERNGAEAGDDFVAANNVVLHYVPLAGRHTVHQGAAEQVYSTYDSSSSGAERSSSGISRGLRKGSLYEGFSPAAPGDSEL